MGCEGEICKTVTVDFTNHIVWLTVIQNKVTVTRIGLTFTEFIGVTDFVVDTVTHNKSHTGKGYSPSPN